MKTFEQPPVRAARSAPYYPRVVLSLCVAGVTLFAATALQAQGPQSITVDTLPASTDEFVSLRDELAGSPEGGAALFVLAMMKFVEDPELGEQFMTIALDRDNLTKSNKGYKGYRPGNSLQYHLNRIKNMKHLPGSYVVGTSAANGYQASAPYRFDFTRNQYSEIKPTQIKVFIACTGASSPRPITLKQNDKGIWKVSEVSSLFVGVAAPQQADGDDI